MDWAADVVFAPWNLMVGKGPMLGWPLCLIGFVWVFVLMIPVMCPALIVSTVMDMHREIKGPDV